MLRRLDPPNAAFYLRLLSLTCCELQMIAEGLHLASDMQIWPSIATQYTDLHLYNSSARSKKQQGARFMTEKTTEAVQKRMPFRMSMEVDPCLLKRTAEYRAEMQKFECSVDGVPQLEHGFDNHMIIPKERALNDPSLEGEPLPDKDALPQTKITHGLFRMFLFMDIVQGTDKAGDPKSMKVSMILLQPSTPGTDPLVAVKQVGEQNSKMSALLLSVLSHMKMVLLNEISTSMSMRDAFSTGTQKEAARLCCEALLPYAVFRFASNYGVLHVNFGGMRMDVDDDEEMKVWHVYQVRFIGSLYLSMCRSCMPVYIF